MYGTENQHQEGRLATALARLEESRKELTCLQKDYRASMLNAGQLEAELKELKTEHTSLESRIPPSAIIEIYLFIETKTIILKRQ